MNDDYLWDRTGEPDKEVQDLEEVLGTLRHQPRPLDLPAKTQLATRRGFAPGLAIAATIALLVLGATLWLHFHRLPAPAPGQTAKQSPPDSGNQSLPKSAPDGQQNVAVVPKQTPRRNEPQGLATTGKTLARNQKRHRQVLIPEDETARLEREEAAVGKEQLLLALRLTSAKLIVAQRKTQGVSAPSTIRNQHKIG